MIRELVFFGLTVGTYSLLSLVAAITGIVMSWRPLRRSGLTVAKTILLLPLLAIAFIVGARLWNVAVEPDSYGPGRPWHTLRMTGFSMYGGIIGAIITVTIFALITRIRLLKLLDAFTVPAAVAFCIARIGCFLNGCCYGKKTDLPWGVVFHSSAGKTATAVHPTQIYELLLALIGIPLCLWLVKIFRAGTGGRFFIYGVWFSTMRLAVHPFRLFPYSYIVSTYIYPMIYYVLIVIGIFFFVYACRKEQLKVC